MIQIMIASFFFWGWMHSFFAKKRGRSPLNWFLIGGFFGVFSFIYLLTRRPPSASTHKKEETKPLPHALWYYLDESQNTQGSMSTPALCKAYLDDKITDSTLVWNEKMDGWAPLHTLPIFSAFTKQT